MLVSSGLWPKVYSGNFPHLNFPPKINSGNSSVLTPNSREKTLLAKWLSVWKPITRTRDSSLLASKMVLYTDCWYFPVHIICAFCARAILPCRPLMWHHIALHITPFLYSNLASQRQHAQKLTTKQECVTAKQEQANGVMYRAVIITKQSLLRWSNSERNIPNSVEILL